MKDKNYLGPVHPERPTRDDIHKALEFLIIIEPNENEIESMEEYEAVMLNYKHQIDIAMKTMKKFAEQISPNTIDNMREVYYSFINNPKYLQTSMDSAVVTSSINKAWNGVGPWRS